MAQAVNTRYFMCEQKMVSNTVTLVCLSCPEYLKSLRSTQGRRSHHPPLSAQAHLHGLGLGRCRAGAARSCPAGAGSKQPNLP